MKTYLALERAAALSGLSTDQLALLCRAGRLEAKQTGSATPDGWFIAEDELVETLATMNRAVVLTELDELARQERAGHQLAATANQGRALLRAASGALAILLVALGVTAWRIHLTTPRGAQLVATVDKAAETVLTNLTENEIQPFSRSEVAALVWSGWQTKITAAMAAAKTRLVANLRALIGSR